MTSRVPATDPAYGGDVSSKPFRCLECGEALDIDDLDDDGCPSCGGSDVDVNLNTPGYVASIRARYAKKRMAP